MTDREAIDNLEYLISGDCCDTQMDYVDEIEFAISTLKEREERSKGCEHCHNKELPYEGGGSHDFRILGNAIYYYDEMYGWEGEEIEFCPWCGRPLKGADNG